ncbi:hypothetical protein [Photobacterium phosphoreum]|uniref:hypothetical protein n=1 Tax=Photobacterium phosphoreum TaxID=659 RepID=UPI001E5AA740|nr:hypothetical protein [Photobacterium phosphoreum]MCD9506578.1 hypothetical protein [Photobacterium phosphoreum]
MNKHQQSGMTTLLITSMLLIVALLFSLASYKNLFYQIKRTQNEVLARKAHWAAEGGLECGFTEYKIKKNNFTGFDECNTTELELTLTPVTSTELHLESKVTNLLSSKIIKKKINVSSRTTGAIQSRSDLKLIGNQDIFPEEVSLINGTSQYECVSVRYSNLFFYEKSGTERLKVEAIYPEQDPDLEENKTRCHKSYRTILSDKTTSNGINNESLKNDFIYDEKFDPFEGFFNRQRSEIDKIRKDYHLITGTKKGCDTIIGAAFKSGHDKVWVTGDCDLGSGLGLFINSVTQKPKVLVFENGIISKFGAVSFYGAVYHLIDKDSIVYPIPKERWEGMDSYVYISDLIKDKSVYIDAGSFNTSGGLIFDTLGGLTTIKGAMDFKYNPNANPLPKEDQVSWQQGSWHDF